MQIFGLKKHFERANTFKLAQTRKFKLIYQLSLDYFSLKKVLFTTFTRMPAKDICHMQLQCDNGIKSHRHHFFLHLSLGQSAIKLI